MGDDSAPEPERQQANPLRAEEAEASRTATIACLATAGLLTLLSLAWLSPERIFFTNDGAATVAVAKGIFDGEFPLAGPPAARGGRHFGPWYFYWQALCLMLSGGSIAGAVVSEAVLKSLLLSLGSVLLLFSLNSRKVPLPALLGMLGCFLSGSWWWVLRTPWHSNFVACVTWPFLFLACLSLERHRIPLSLQIFAGGLLLQTHLATLPLVFVCLSMSFAVRFLRPRDPGEKVLLNLRFERMLWPITALTWLPTLIFLIQGTGQLFGQAVNAAPHQVRVGISQASVLTAQIFRRYIINDHSWADLAAPLPAWTGQFYAGLLLVALLGAVFSAEHAARLRFFAIFAAITAYAVAISLLRPPVHFHYEHSIILLAPIFAGCAINQSVSWLRGITNPARPLSLRLPLGIIGLVVLCMFLLTSVHASGRTLEMLHQPPFPRYQTLLHAQEMSEKIAPLNLMPETMALVINERDRLRESPVYLFLGQRFFWKMQYARYFTELPSFRIQQAMDLQTLLLTSCEQRDVRQVERNLRGFRPVEEVPLEECGTCDPCRLQIWRK